MSRPLPLKSAKKLTIAKNKTYKDYIITLINNRIKEAIMIGKTHCKIENDIYSNSSEYRQFIDIINKYIKEGYRFEDCHTKIYIIWEEE